MSKRRKRKAPVIGPPRPVEPIAIYWQMVALMPGEKDPRGEPPLDKKPAIHRTWGGVGEIGRLTKKKP